jgi:hypothetical protein
MKTAAKPVIIATVFAILGSCAPARFVKPLQKEQDAVSFSFGGPLIIYSGAPIPLPFTTLAYGRGITDKITGFGSLHTTSLLFGNMQSDIGSTIALFERPSKGGVSVTPALQLAYSMSNQKSFRFWPTIDLNGWLHISGSPSYVYAGINSWIETTPKRAHNEVQPRRVVPALTGGYALVRTKWTHQFQVSYIGAGIPNLPGVVDYAGISGKGALGFHYAVSMVFK